MSSDLVEVSGMETTPLMKAVRHGNLKKTRELLRCGADPTELNPFGVDLLVLACASGVREIVELVYEELKTVSKSGSPDLGPALRTAALFGHGSVVHFLIQQKCDLNDRDEDSGVTPLMLAVCNGSAEVVRLLLSRGANPRVCNEFNQTASDIAAARGLADIVSLLAEHRCEVRIPRIILTAVPHQSGNSKVSTPTSDVGPKALDAIFSSPVSPISTRIKRGCGTFPCPRKLNSSLQATPQHCTKRLKLNRTHADDMLKADYAEALSWSSVHSSGFSSVSLGSDEGSCGRDGPRVDHLPTRLTFREKIDMLDSLVPNTALERLKKVKPLWRSLSSRLQIIRKRKRSGYSIASSSRVSLTEGRQHSGRHRKSSSVPYIICSSTSDPGFCEREEASKSAHEDEAATDCVSNLLKMNELFQYIPLFQQHEIDLLTLAHLTEEDLTEMGVAEPSDRRAVLRMARLITNC